MLFLYRSCLLKIKDSWFLKKAKTTEAHYNDVIMSVKGPRITSLTIVYSSVYPGAYQRKHKSSASLAFVRGIHRWPMNSPHKGPVTRKTVPFDDVIIRNHLAQVICVFTFRNYSHTLRCGLEWINHQCCFGIVWWTVVIHVLLVE